MSYLFEKEEDKADGADPQGPRSQEQVQEHPKLTNWLMAKLGGSGNVMKLWRSDF